MNYTIMSSIIVSFLTDNSYFFPQVVNLNLALNILLSILQVHFTDKKQHSWLFFKAESRAPLLPQETSGPASQQHWTDMLKFLSSFSLFKGSRKWKIRQLPACGGLPTHSIYSICKGLWTFIAFNLKKLFNRIS